MRCSEIMTRDIVSLRPSDRVDSAARRMRDQNVGFAPVCGDDGRPVGAVTDRDIAIRICAQDRRAGRTHVDDIMTRELLTCRGTDDLERAEALMAERHKNRIMVVDSDGRLTGVMSIADVAEHEDDARAMRTIQRVLEREVRGAARRSSDVPSATARRAPMTWARWDETGTYAVRIKRRPATVGACSSSLPRAGRLSRGVQPRVGPVRRA